MGRLHLQEEGGVTELKTMALLENGAARPLPYGYLVDAGSQRLTQLWSAVPEYLFRNGKFNADYITNITNTKISYKSLTIGAGGGTHEPRTFTETGESDRIIEWEPIQKIRFTGTLGVIGSTTLRTGVFTAILGGRSFELARFAREWDFTTSQVSFDKTYDISDITSNTSLQLKIDATIHHASSAALGIGADGYLSAILTTG